MEDKNAKYRIALGQVLDIFLNSGLFHLAEIIFKSKKQSEYTGLIHLASFQKHEIFSHILPKE
jgi:hypothetical protein